MSAPDDPPAPADPPTDDAASEAGDASIAVDAPPEAPTEGTSDHVDALPAPLPGASSESPEITAEERELVAEPPTLCLNCGARLPGEYCPRCGQRDQSLRVPVHHFLRDGLKELFGIDGRVWRTYGTLLFKPGVLTTEYFKGRRRRSLSPLRVYIVSTLAFFVLLTVLDPIGRVNAGTSADIDGRSPDSLVVVSAELARVEGELATADSARARYGNDVRDALADALRQDDPARSAARVERLADSIAAATVESAIDWSEWDGPFGDSLGSDLDDLIDEAIDAVDEPPSDSDRLGLAVEASVLRALPSDSLVRVGDLHAARVQIVPDVNVNVGLPDWLPRSGAMERLAEARADDDRRAAMVEIGRSALRQIPTALFLLLPLFALLLKLVYVRRGWYYSEHLVFGLHVHAAAFVALTLALLISFATGGGGVNSAAEGFGGAAVSVLILAIPVYYLVAAWRVYRQGVGKTLAKAIVVGWVYAFALLVLGLGLTVVLTALNR